MKRLTATLAVTLLAGCATPQSGHWMNATGDGSRFEQDKAQCIYESNLATASAPSTFSLSQNIAQDIATGMRQGELQQMCLRAKGYYWVQDGTSASVDNDPDFSRRYNEMMNNSGPIITEKH